MKEAVAEREVYSGNVDFSVSHSVPVFPIRRRPEEGLRFIYKQSLVSNLKHPETLWSFIS